MPRALPGANGPTDWNEALDIISFGSPEQVLSYSVCVLFSLFCFCFLVPPPLIFTIQGTVACLA